MIKPLPLLKTLANIELMAHHRRILQEASQGDSGQRRRRCVGQRSAPLFGFRVGLHDVRAEVHRLISQEERDVEGCLAAGRYRTVVQEAVALRV